MRRELVKSIYDEVSESAMVIREGADIEEEFPLVVVAFLGGNRMKYRWLSGTRDGRENWTNKEKLNIYIFTRQNGSGTDRIELQKLLDKIEFMTRDEWPSLVKEYTCGIYYPESWVESSNAGFYNEIRVNVAVLSICLLEPRYPTSDDTTGPPVERVSTTVTENEIDELIEIDVSI